MSLAAKDPRSVNVNVNVVNASSNPNAHASHNAPANNPEALIDTIDAFHRKHQPEGNNHNHKESGHGGTTSHNVNDNKQSSSASTSTFDPVEFLNHHYKTESSLISALPSLRSTLNRRMSTLDESISSTIQKQSDLADLTYADVSRAKTAVQKLHDRVTTVQIKAQQSEQAVQEITREMKRLDYAKKHLSKTITALKRLHMLIHAVSQLRHSVRICNPPDYTNAANLIGATQLLLGHFRLYMDNVEKMRLLKNDVEEMRIELNDGIVFGFRVVGFGFQGAMDRREKDINMNMNIRSTTTTSGSGSGSGTTARKNIKKTRRAIGSPPSSPTNQNDARHSSSPSSSSPEDEEWIKRFATPLPPETLTNACHVLDALGPEKRSAFVKTFCGDHLDPYIQLFHPSKNTSSGGVSASAATPQKPSFKIMLNNNNNNNNEEDNANSALSNPNPASLDQMERRYAWYRRMLRELDETFPSVFPKHWNMEYRMTHAFLIETGRHILILFSGHASGSGSSSGNSGNGSGSSTVGGSNTGGAGGGDTNMDHLKDRDCENVTVLLKALQKTILFEKEMTAWLQREYGTIFLDGTNADQKKSQSSASSPVGEDGEPLEFDERGNAVAASSAEGIRIKYERQMNDRKKREEKASGGGSGKHHKHKHTKNNHHPSLAEDENGNLDLDQFNRGVIDTPVNVPPLMGVASSAFERFMGPYIALEEQNMEEQLKESVSDKTVDTRGELPVFTSSTALFLYIKNSITRCTALTNRKTLFLLYRAFQRTLRKYAKVLSGKYPSALSGPAAAIGGISIAGLSGNSGVGGGTSAGVKDVYRIPPGEETTICHVIDTCEYCTDTVEALQDLIIDKIEDKYKDKIDMSGEEEAFHDVTAKGIRVLVSGLVQRSDQAFKGIYNIAWSSIDVVGEESPYVRSMHSAIQPFVIKVKSVLPGVYFRNFCDQFAMVFTNTFYDTIVRLKRISESGTQQLLLDVYNLKTLLLKIPVLEVKQNSDNVGSPSTKVGSSSSIAPAMYTKTVTKQFQRIEILLKLVGTPSDLLIDVFKVQWPNGSAYDLSTIMNLKGMKRNEQAAMLKKIGIDPITAMKGAAAASAGVSMTENIQSLQDKSSDVAAKVNSDLVQMRQKVEDFRKAFR